MVHGEEALLEDVAKLESKLKAIRRKGNLVLESQICNVLGKKYEALGEWKEALTFHYFDAEIGAAMDDYEGQMIALHNMGMVYQRLKMYMKARRAFKRMISVAEKVPSLAEKRILNGLVDANIGLGALFLDQLYHGDCPIVNDELLRRAYDCFDRASTSSRRFSALLAEGSIGNTSSNRRTLLEMEIKVLMALGQYHRHEDQDAALVYFNRAKSKIVGLEQEEDTEETWYIYECRLYEETGFVLGAAGKWNEAIESCFDKQLLLAKDWADDERAADAQYNLAQACHELGDLALARSTILTCLDTIKVRCQDQTKLERAEVLFKIIFEDVQREDSLEELRSRLAGANDFDSKFDYSFQMAKALLRLKDYTGAFALAKTLPTFLSAHGFSQDIHRKVFGLLTDLCLKLKSWQDAMFFARKWFSFLEDDDEPVVRLPCLLSLVEAHVKAESIDDFIEHRAAKSLELCRVDERRRHDDEIRALAFLAVVKEMLGKHGEADMFRQECLGLRMAILKEAEQIAGQDFEGIEDSSYFGDRKVSKSTKSLMGGDFQMRTRTHKSGVISKRRCKPTGTSKPRSTALTKKPSRRTAVLEESASDLDDFIASSSSSDFEKENRHMPRKKKIKALAVESSETSEPDPITIGDDDNVLSTTFANAISISNSQQIDTDYDETINEPFAAPDAYIEYNDFNADTAYRPLAIRVKVRVEEHTLVIPCFDEDITERKRISWLIKEAAKRYAELDAKEPLIKALSYDNDNVFLSLNDPISLVLRDGQTIKAHIAGWRKRSWLQEYEYQIQRLDTPSNDFLTAYFGEKSLESFQIDMSFTDMSQSDRKVLFAVLEAKSPDYPGFDLDLSGSVLDYLTGLRSVKLNRLDVSFCEIPNFEEFLFFLADVLPGLKSLSICYLQMDQTRLHDTFQLFGRIGLQCQLETLVISGYSLDPQVDFEKLQYLNELRSLICEASFFPQEALESLLRFLPKSHNLQSLSLSLESNDQAELVQRALKGTKVSFTSCY